MEPQLSRMAHAKNLWPVTENIFNPFGKFYFLASLSWGVSLFNDVSCTYECLRYLEIKLSWNKNNCFLSCLSNYHLIKQYYEHWLIMCPVAVCMDIKKKMSSKVLVFLCTTWFIPKITHWTYREGSLWFDL